MFGSNCHRREFLNARQGKNHSQQGYDTSILNGFEDTVDGRLYATAERIFWLNVRKFGVHRQSCLETCKDFPGPFEVVATDFSGETVTASGERVKFGRKRDDAEFEYDWPGRHV